MAELGTVVALIKSMSGADPAVIAEAVAAWLDEHPEATTTVQDGSITEAKLAQDVLADLAEVDTLSEAITPKPTTKTGVDLDITDPNGNVIVRLASGDIKTKNFDSAKSPIVNTDDASADLDICDPSGNVIMRMKDGHVMTKNFDSSEIMKADQYGVVEENRFVSNETGWTYENCTASDGITLTTESKAYRAKVYTNDSWYIRSVFEINTLGSVFGLVMESSNKGALYLVDSEEGTISLRKQYTGSYTPTDVVVSEEIGFILRTGTRYILEVHKTGYAHKFTITDEQTQESTSVFYDNAPQTSSSYYCGKGHGGPGVICISGSVSASNVMYSVKNYPHARVLFIGDSITEGTNIHTNIDNRWCNLVAKELYNNDAFIMGSGGDTSGGLSTRLQDAIDAGFGFDIAVVLIGTNELNEQGTISTWSNNISTIVGQIENLGATPVVCVPPLAKTYNNTIFNMRDFILEKGWQTIRFDYATSVDRDGETFDQNCFTDNTHPNALGSYRMYQQAIADIHAI